MRIYLVLVSLLFVSPVFGQQLPYAQFEYVNPLLISAKLASDNFASATVIHNNQKIVQSGKVLSTNVFGKYPIVNRENNRLVLGISFNENRVKGPAALTDQQLSATLAYGAKTNKFSTLSFSMDIAIVTRRINWEGIQTGSMWVPGMGFDPSAPTGESLVVNKISYPKLNASLYWNYTNSKGDELVSLGLGIHQLNKYKDSFYDVNTKVVNRQLFLSGAIRVVERGKFAISPKVLFYTQESYSNLRIGADFNYALYRRYSRDPRSTNSINFGANYHFNKGAQFTMQYLQPKYILGFAYHLDTNIGSESNIYNNAFEVMVIVRNPIAPKSRRGGKINGLKRIKPPKKSKKKPEREPKEVANPVSTPPDRVVLEQTPVLVEPNDSSSVEDEKPGVEENNTMQSELDQWRTSVGLGNENQLNFEFNSTEVSEDSYNTIVWLVELLKAHENAMIILLGHTDNIGSDHSNHRLSVQRAKAVQDILVDLGTPKNKIIIQGKGEAEPIAENNTSDGRDQNRRVEFIIIE